MKKLWGILLSLAILTTAMPVCSFAETPEAGANGTFSLFVGLQEPAINTTNHDILAWSEAQKQTGIQIEFVHGGGENLNLMIASNDLTDAIYQFWPDFSGGAQGALDNGTIIPLPKEMLAKAAPHYWAYLHAWPELIKMMTTDNGTHFQVGGVMTWEQEESLGATPVLQRAPFYESWMGLILRTDLLEKTGLSVPVTVDDWTQVLRAFKAMDIASPMSATVSNLKTSNAFAGAFGIAHGLYQDAEGIAHYGPMEEGYQTYLTLLHQWYTEGLLDADYAALDGNMARAKLISGESAATIGTGGWIGISYESAHELTPDTDYYLKAIAHPTLDAQHLIAPYGQRAYPYIGGIAITPACKDPEVVLNFFDYYWTDEGSVTANWGVEGVSYERNENGLPVFSEKLAQNEWGYSVSVMTQKVEMLNGPFPIDLRNRLFSMTLYATPEALPCRGIWSNSALPATMPPYVVPSIDAADFATLGNEIQTYVDEMHVKFIMGLEPLDHFDAFQKQMEKIGVQQYLSIAQKALDNYNARQ